VKREIGKFVDYRGKVFSRGMGFNVMPSILEPVKGPDFSGDELSKIYRKKLARLI
jgi:hypothetical protein